MKNLDSINSSIEMEKEKNKKIIKITGIVLAVLLVIILIVGVILYLATDIFKSDKELFLKYIGQTLDEDKGFIDKDMINYLEKKNTTPYTNDGTFSTRITVSDEEKSQILEDTNNFNISFTGKTDKINSKSEQEISLNYSDEVSLPINYKKIGDLIGLRIEEVANEYIAVDASNTEEIFGVDLKSILESTENPPDTINLTEEEKKQIKESYTQALDQQLTKDKFSKVVGPEADGYRLTLKGEDIKNILICILETTKNNQVILDKINEINTSEEQITSENIDEIISNLNGADATDNKVDITVYCVKKVTNKITVETSDGISLEISKAQENDSVKYNIIGKGQGDTAISNIGISIGYTGMNSQDVSENYTFRCGINNDGEETYYDYNINNNVNFADSVEIEDFDENEIIKLTDYDQQQVAGFFLELAERLENVSSKMLQEAEIDEDRNPLLYMIPGFSDISSVMEESIERGSKTLNEEQESQEQQDEQENENNEQTKASKEEACEKINMVLKVIMDKLSQTTDISNEQISNLLAEAGLTQENENGSYASTSFTAVPEGDDNTVFAIKWTSTDGEEVIGGITYDANSENKYQMKSAE